MKLENLKDEFPQMPEEMRTMVEREVQRQMKVERPRFGRRKQRRRIAALALASALGLSVTAFAGVKLYQIYVKPEGAYGVKTGVLMEENTGDTSGKTGSDAQEKQVPEVELRAGYLPEGMVEAPGGGKFYYEDTPQQGGISCSMSVMEAGDSGSELLTTNVTFSEEISVSGHEGVYLELHQANPQEKDFGKRMYIAYPEVSRMLELFVGNDVTKEEVLKFAENLELAPTGEWLDREKLYTWSDLVQQQKGETMDVKLSASREEMANTHEIGEAFILETMAETEQGESVDPKLEVKVTQVQVADDLSLLEKESCVPEEWKQALDENGKLAENEVLYMKNGDGIDTVDEQIDTETVGQRLVYATVELTNTEEETLKNVLYFGGLIGLEEEGDTFTLYDRSTRKEGCDQAENTGIARISEMKYFDVQGGENTNGSNYITTMEPGETVTVNMGFVVNEDELGYLFFYMDGGSYEFSESGLETGYVDIRQ